MLKFNREKPKSLGTKELTKLGKFKKMNTIEVRSIYNSHEIELDDKSPSSSPQGNLEF